MPDTPTTTAGDGPALSDTFGRRVFSQKIATGIEVDMPYDDSRNGQRWEPVYGRVRVLVTTDPVERINHAAVLEVLRRRVCNQSRAGQLQTNELISDTSTCDCKYGLGERLTDNNKLVGRGSSEATGCPELRDMIYALLHGDYEAAPQMVAQLLNENRSLKADWQIEHDEKANLEVQLTVEKSKFAESEVARNDLIAGMVESDAAYQQSYNERTHEIGRLNRVIEEMNEPMKISVRQAPEGTPPMSSFAPAAAADALGLDPVYAEQEGTTEPSLPDNVLATIDRHFEGLKAKVADYIGEHYVEKVRPTLDTEALVAKLRDVSRRLNHSSDRYVRSQADRLYSLAADVEALGGAQSPQEPAQGQGDPESATTPQEPAQPQREGRYDYLEDIDEASSYNLEALLEHLGWTSSGRTEGLFSTWENAEHFVLVPLDSTKSDYMTLTERARRQIKRVEVIR